MGSLAILFAGQGAQHPGMGSSICGASDAARAIFSSADSLRPGTSAQCFEGTAEELALTKNTQPCVFTVDLACAAALVERGVHADHLAGFSLGELAALTHGGVFTLDEGFATVMTRSQHMDACCACNPGCMVAVLKLAPEQVVQIAAKAGNAWPVNYNSPQQTVVACTPDSLDRLVTLVKEQGGRAMPLAVSGAFHSPLMDGATRALRPFLENIAPAAPQVSVWSNVTASPYPADTASIVDLLARQASSPVLWTRTLEGMAAAGVTHFVEVGPGKVLTGLVRRTLPDAVALNVETEEELEAALELLAGDGMLG